MIIRPARLSDYKAISNLLAKTKLVDFWFSRELFRKMMKRNQGLYFVAEEKGEIIGSIFSSHDGGYFGYIYKIAVDPRYRRRGIARALTNKVLGVFQKLGIEWVFAHVAKSNKPSTKLLTGLGFKVRKTYYPIDIEFPS